MIDPTLIPIIRGLATQIFEAKVIADRLGLDCNFMGTAAEEPSSDPEAAAPTVTHDEIVRSLMERIRKMSDTMLLIKLGLESEDTDTDMSTEEQERMERAVLHSIVPVPISSIISFYDRRYFNGCEPSLKRLVAKVLCQEFARRKCEPLPMWLNYLR
jgi:hypothetical protein